ncbi:DUF4142 domain-containing protein [Prauserella muralis]|uniref:DUF4142 domain-containing protein n=1 Tax=Prauserella muralis TaxID=588067 RepID=A0A2V4B2B5_9PSEU|nr:DUF4142 domain-containing protein [Prauserella muralis]PXY28177.1 hypothetical protein BAY60_17770 [Prauserella muralis]TWE22009.1 secreted repeat protein with Y-X4-D motif [Prauserella muralis]
MARPKRSAGTVAAGLVLLALTAACDDSNSYGSYYSSGTNDSVRIHTVAQESTAEATLPLHAAEAFDIGRMVVDDNGFALYRYDRDSADPPRSRCENACARTWRPVPARGELRATGIDQSLLGTVTRSDGTDQLTLNGRPLYRYTGDEMPGETSGHGADGAWFPVTPDGGKVRDSGAIARAENPGTLTDTDVELLVKVRQAGLWEMPSATWARERGASERVRAIGLPILVDHGRLDAATTDLAARFGVRLPSEPTVKQQDWLGEMRSAGSGEEFDRIFANRLRLAHGKVLTYIANVRAGTRNETMRQYASTGNQAVLRHITLLESTGLVDFEALPAPVLDASATSAGAALDTEATDVFLGVVLAVFVSGATVLLLWLTRQSRRRKAAAPGGADDLTATTESGERTHA